MGGTVLDMFTLDATPLSLSYHLFFFREGDTVVPGISLSPPVPFFLRLSFVLLRTLSSLFFLFPRVQSKAPRKYSLGERPIMPCRREPARNFRVLIKHGALNGWCFRRRELETRHALKRSVIAKEIERERVHALFARLRVVNITEQQYMYSLFMLYKSTISISRNSFSAKYAFNSKMTGRINLRENLS